MSISSKPYKQWCKARGINFLEHIRQFPLTAVRLDLPKVVSPVFAVKKLTIWEKIKNFFRY